MPGDHALDRPIWNTLISGWSSRALGGPRAWQLDPSYGPFGAAASAHRDDMAALAALVPNEGELWAVETESLPSLPGIRVARTAVLAQMVAARLPPRCAADPRIVVLGEESAAAMHALANLTRPGPFERQTHRLGRFLGIHHDGGLIAMAGERMRLPGFAEVSGVCTHPDHRGRGLAAVLMAQVALRMAKAGETPFLHSYADNATAIALYERLGFAIRRHVTVSILVRDQ